MSGTDSAAVGRQFVTFWVDGGIFGVPLGEVQEIIRMPGTVHVPMAPDSLEGIANLRGAVLPITNLRRLFGMSEAAHNDATRVVVLNNGALSGFAVDRMASVITTEADEIEPADAMGATVSTDLLQGIVKGRERMIMLLYFDDASRRRAVEALYEALRPGGFLCLGHSESMSRMSSLFTVRKFKDAIVYQKPV